MKQTELLIIDEPVRNGIRVCLKSKRAQVITPTLIKEVRHFQQSLLQRYMNTPWNSYLYIIWYAHRGADFFNGGLDFNYIYFCLLKNKLDKINDYINEAIEMLFLNYIGLGLPIINCSIVEHSVRGLSQEFFSLNKVSFIRKNTLNGMGRNLSLVSVDHIMASKILPDFLYKKNQFYIFEQFNFSLMRKILGQFEDSQLKLVEINLIKEVFDQLKQQTLDTVYSRISSNPDLIKRAAMMQKKHAKIIGVKD